MEFLPLALEYGMSVDMFWFYDEEYFKAYQKAYFNRLSREKWIEGKYFMKSQRLSCPFFATTDLVVSNQRT